MEQIQAREQLYHAKILTVLVVFPTRHLVLNAIQLLVSSYQEVHVILVLVHLVLALQVVVLLPAVILIVMTAAVTTRFVFCATLPTNGTCRPRLFSADTRRSVPRFKRDSDQTS